MARGTGSSSGNRLRACNNGSRFPHMGKALPRSFYSRSAVDVARDLLGRHLVRRLPEGAVAGRIVECEAYEEGDPASHSFRGLTDRTAVMFGPPGRLYVYFSYGMHFCMNVVTGTDGEGSAVLLRAVEPLEGIDLMRERRGVTDPRILCAGPGRLTQAFGVSRADNGLDLVSGSELFVTEGTAARGDEIGVGRRIGITVATEKPWRFHVIGSPFVSSRLPSPQGRRAASRPDRARATGTAKAKGKATAKASEKVKERGTATHSTGEGGSPRLRSA
jgi:DNA-3-methyladenine glycosylase